MKRNHKESDQPVIVEAGAVTVGNCPFVDGKVRVVPIDKEGRQYVLDDDGNRVVGVWLAPCP
jgi:hypothetical protein